MVEKKKKEKKKKLLKVGAFVGFEFGGCYFLFKNARKRTVRIIKVTV